MILPKTMRGVAFLIVMFVSANAWAVTSSLWEEDTRKAFDAGQPEDVSIIEPGKIILGPSAKVTTLEARYGWVLLEDSKGRIYTGTGNDGKIFRISPGGEAEEFADLDLQQVFALVIDKKDRIYAAGFPGGKVYSVDTKGEISEYFDTGQDAVWSLYLGIDGTLFAATGDKGEIFSIKGPEEGKILYDSPQRIILSLLGDSESNLYAGTGEGGIIYKIDKNGHPTVLYNTELDEVRSMTMDSAGNLYAVSSPGNLFLKVPPPQAAPQMPKAMEEGGAVPPAVAIAAAAAQAQAAALPIPGMPAIPSPKKRTCIVYKIAKSGAASQFWTSPEKLIYSIVFDGDDLLAGSGDEGIIYMISPTGEEGTYYKANQKQVLDLYRSKNGAIIASLGNDAAVIQFRRGYASSGTFISQVHDATTVSQWGRVFWEAEVPQQTSISLATRSGNSQSPDDTWSEWSKGRADKQGFTSESPGSRYIQWKATLSTSNSQKTPTLRKVTVAYIQTNLPPEMQSVTVGATAAKKEGPPAAELAAAIKAIAGGAIPSPTSEEGGVPKVSAAEVKAVPSTHETKLKIQWQAKDPNNDTLEYTVYFKGVEETRWLLLKEKLHETNYDWDTEAVPDGEYHIKVAASDAPSNPVGTELTAEKVSDGFMIDNTPPTVKVSSAVHQKSGSYQITATISDNLSPVNSAEYSIDAGEWQDVLPVDGIFDSLVEKVVFTTEKLEKGEHTVALKATDYFGNVSAGKITFVAE